MIFQQVNLYQPLFRQQQKVFSAKTMAQSLGAVATGLALFFGYAYWQAAALEEQARQTTQRRDEVAARLESLRQTHAESASDPVKTQAMERLAAELATRQRILAQIGSTAQGNTAGFASHLEGLARQRPGSLWLSHVSIAKGGTDVTLTGSSLQPAEVPRYLQRLTGEAVFRGTEFRHLEISRPEAAPGRVDFVVQTTPPKKEGP